jgi:hypothetical protein
MVQKLGQVTEEEYSDPIKREFAEGLKRVA